ncbi:MAG: Gx transporter family protein [Calditrichia bacterium]
MSSRTAISKPSPDSSTRKEAHLVGLIALGLLLFLFEAYIPKPVPWLKLGLANVVTLIALYWYGGKAALLVSISRILIGSVFTGNLLTPGFFLSLGGGLCAVSAMILLYHSRLFGIWGVSMGGAAFHSLGQILVGYFVLFDNPVILQILPYLIFYSILSGTLIGWIGYLLIKRLEKEFAF